MELIAPSGAEVVISVAPWKAAKVLKAAIERELINLPSMSLAAVMLVDSSPAVDAALWPCLNRCTYNGEKIIDSTFDRVEARADYYFVVEACIKENLLPLAAGLRSKLLEYGIIKAQAPKDQAPGSTTPTP